MEYLFIFISLFLCERGYFWIANRFNIIDKPNERSSHAVITLRGGGIIFYIGVLLYAAFFGLGYPWFILGLTLLTIISFVDDIFTVRNTTRLLIHFIAMLLMFWQWNLFVEFPGWYVLVALVFCTGVINAYNFMDGINGMTGGYSFVILSALAYINWHVVEFIAPTFIYTVLLSVAVFNFYNFRTKAKCFAGDVGAVSIAFIILFLLGKLILATGDFSYIILLLVYGVDSVLTIIHRLILRENIFAAHRKHVYQIMANELGMKHLSVSILYAVFQSVIIAAYFLLPIGVHWLYFLVAILSLSIGYVMFIKKYFQLHR